jgi:16S rRNA processing protein RimM
MLLEGVDDRDAALALKGLTVMLSREQFPDAGENSYYWIDLIGSEVENLQGIHLGKVEDISEFGAHPVMKIGDELIPFVEAIVKSVDLKTSQSKGKIVVDWQPNWSR